MSYIRSNTLKDSVGNEVEVGAFGALKVSQTNGQISLVFNKPINESKDLRILGNVKTQVNRSLLEVGNQIGLSLAESRDFLRYKTAQTVEFNWTASWSRLPSIGEYAYVGGFDSYDGVFIGYEQDGSFRCKYRNVYADNGVGNAPDVVSPAIDVSAYEGATPGLISESYRFRCRFGYLGVGDIIFEIKPKNGGSWQVLYIFRTDGTLNKRTHVGSAILPMRSEVQSNDATLSICSGSWNGSTYGIDNKLQEEPFFTQGNVVGANQAAGDEQALVAFKSLVTFGGFPNKVKSKLLNSEFATNDEGLYRFNFYAYPDGTITTGVFNDIRANESVLQVNDTVTTIPVGSDLVFSQLLAVGSSGQGVATATLDFSLLGIVASPSQEFLITKECLVSGNVNGPVVAWNIAYADMF